MIKLSTLNKTEALELFKKGGEQMWFVYLKNKKYTLLDRLKKPDAVDIKMSNLCGDLKKKLTERFGKQLFCYTTWYRGHNWFFEYKNLTISVNSSIRGTEYVIYNFENVPTEELTTKIKGFINEFHLQMIKK